MFRRGRWVESKMAQHGDALSDEDGPIPSHFEPIGAPEPDPTPSSIREPESKEPMTVDLSEFETKPGSNWYEIPGVEGKIQGAEKAREALAASFAADDAEAEGSDDDSDGDDGEPDGGTEDGDDDADDES